VASGTALVLAAWFGAAVPDQLASHPWTLEARTRKWHSIAEAMWHRRRPNLVDFRYGHHADAERLRAYANWRAQHQGAEPVIATGGCLAAYLAFDRYVVHAYGLTDPILARIPAKFGRPGHKYVQRHAAHLRRLHVDDARDPGRGLVDAWMRHPKVPTWIRRNEAALRLLEQKTYNRHNLGENLRLALTRVRLR
jgi:hypothetical protein